MEYYCRVGQQRLHSLQQENEAFVGAAIITQLSNQPSATAPELNEVAAQPAATFLCRKLTSVAETHHSAANMSETDLK